MAKLSGTPMAQADLSQEQLIELVSSITTLTLQMKQLTDTVAAQEIEIKKLLAIVERGKGSIWLLVMLGGVIGWALSNIRGFLDLASK